MVTDVKAFASRRLALQEQAPKIILIVTALATLAGLICWSFWRATGKTEWATLFFEYPNAILTIALSAVAVYCSYYAWRAFSPGDALRNAWLFLLLASITHFIGRALSQALFRIPGPEAGQVLYDAGIFLGGPAEMMLLLPGLACVARVCRRSGLVGRMTAVDYALVVMVAANGIHTVIEIREFIAAGKPITWAQALQWPADPLMIVLLMIAITIRRSVATMGWGFIASCWAAYAASVVFVSFGDIFLWLIRTTYIPWGLATLGWYVWLLADAAFALAPAYQAAAIARARFRTGLSQAISPVNEPAQIVALGSPQ